MSISVQSNAKINLALYINHKRNDGYHDISTLMQEINFRDEIIISKNFFVLTPPPGAFIDIYELLNTL